MSASAALDLDRLRRRLAVHPRAAVQLDGFRESAVLVPLLVDDEGTIRLVFTVRKDELRSHAGQVAFPGGRRDPGDPDLATTAIREAEEELGIPPARVDVLGWLDDVPTPSGYVITPVVGVIAGPIELHPSPSEVAAVFLPELAALRDPARYGHAGERQWLGVRYTMHEYRWEPWRIWGATARILHQVLELLDGE